jgi:hypothetical protein
MEAVFVFRPVHLHISVAGNPHVLYLIGWNLAGATQLVYVLLGLLNYWLHLQGATFHNEHIPILCKANLFASCGCVQEEPEVVYLFHYILYSKSGNEKDLRILFALFI